MLTLLIIEIICIAMTLGTVLCGNQWAAFSIFIFITFITFQRAENMLTESSRNNSLRSGSSKVSVVCGSEDIGFRGRLSIYILEFIYDIYMYILYKYT